MSKIRGTILIAVFLLPLLAVIAAAAFWFVPNRPSEGIGTIEFVVKRGMIFPEIARKLEQEGLIQNADYITWRYKILSKLDLIGKIQAGRFSLQQGLKPSQYITILTSPSAADRVSIDLTIPPGLTSSQIAQRVEDAQLTRSGDIIAAIRKLASEYPIVQRPEGLQGYLFPDTYKIEKPLEGTPSEETANDIVRQMANKFFEVLDDVDPSWKDLTPIRLHEKITLASIVEREYRVPEEAPMIAAVFNNRIIDGSIGLQSCATVAYVIEETEEGAPYKNEYHDFNRRIFEHFLKIPSLYNTYVNKGLPPGPISIPGETALEAAFFPANTDALYFVVKDPVAGTHVFSRSYDAHLNARRAYIDQYVVKD